ncbi:MAG: phosphate:Na+ symporter, partial [Pseudomonadota bacterium]|nr:phosphate:Na+ symporter [Pseudomonadota bacterium]
TVTAVGFVGAGLMSFSQALGVIFGANIGTTLRGWVIVLVGFKLQLGLILMPLILFGALARLLSRSHMAHIGFALAGFGLIFVGIDMMQSGMKGLTAFITPDIFPADTWNGRVQLLLTGIVFTAITQSSGAGVAATLTALFAGAINFPQAAVLVIGMDIGTTVTAAVATIGGNVGARRTGFSHVIFNLLSGVLALLLLTPYMHFMELFTPGILISNAEFSLVAFHTGFNLASVLLVLPLAGQFARLVEKLFPEHAPVYTQGLEPSLLREPGIALTACHAAMHNELLALLVHVRTLLGAATPDDKIDLQELKAALNKTHDYIDQIHLQDGDSPHWNQLLALIHALDHMQRLHERCDEDTDRAATARTTPVLSAVIHEVKNSMDSIADQLSDKHPEQARSLAEQNLRLIDTHAEPLRARIMGMVASGKLNIAEGTDCVEAVRWLQRVSVHVDRITHHLLVAGRLHKK